MSFLRFRQRITGPNGAPLLREGCESHGITADHVTARWRTVEAGGMAASVCACCCAPCRPEALVCTRCDGADLDALRKAPPCSTCGGPADRLDATGRAWRCKAHAEGGA